MKSFKGFIGLLVAALFFVALSFVNVPAASADGGDVDAQIRTMLQCALYPETCPFPLRNAHSQPASFSVPAAANTCRDGEPQPNVLNLLDRIPIGLGENNAGVEVAWQPGSGFGGWYRTVLVVPTLGSNFQVFLNGVKTIHMVRYCGTLTAVEAYAPTHVNAMVQTAADGSGNKPSSDEIGVYSLDLSTGNLKVIKAASSGPSLSEIKSHIEVVRVR